MVERNLAKVDVVGSNPIIRSHLKHRGCSSVVERNLAKVDVVGSNPIIRSHRKPALKQAFLFRGIPDSKVTASRQQNTRFFS